jgi:prevent-host-death family protein
MVTMTSREFNRHASEAKKAALTAPVFITVRGRPEYVLLSIEEYRNLTKRNISILEQLSTSGIDTISIEISPSQDLVRTASFK